MEANLVFEAVGEVGRIVCCDVHPVKPWIVVANDSGTVYVIDYKLAVITRQFQMSSAENRKREEQRQQRWLTSDPNYTGERPSDSQQSSSTLKSDKVKTGSMRAVRFCDASVFRLLRLLELSQAELHTVVKETIEQQVDNLEKNQKKPKRRTTDVQRRKAEAQSSEMMHTATNHRFLNTNEVVALADHRILFFDYMTGQCREIDFKDLGTTKPLQTMEFISDRPWILFGGADGIVRVWDYEQWKLLGKFPAIHKGAVVKIFTFEIGSLKYALSADQAGTAVLWNLQNIKNPEVSHRKMHQSSELIAFEYHPIALSMVATFADKTLVVWEPFTNRLIGSKKKLKRVPAITSLVVYPRPDFPTQSCLVACKDETRIFLLDPETSAATEHFDLAAVPSSVPLAKTKIYSLAVHPLRHHLVFCCAKPGLFVLSIDEARVPRTCRPKSQSIFYTTSKGRVLQHNIDDPRALPESMHTLPEEAETAKLFVDPDSHFASLVADGLAFYQVLDVSEKQWTSIHDGHGRHWAWSGNRNGHTRFAVLEYEQTEDHDSSGKKKKKKKGQKDKNAKDQPQTHSLRATLKIKELVGTNKPALVRTLREDLAVDGNVLRLHSGHLLGISITGGSFSKPCPRLLSVTVDSVSNPGFLRAGPVHKSVSVASQSIKRSGSAVRLETLPSEDDESSSRRQLYFYSWETFEPVGPPLPDPVFIEWDLSKEFCLLVYPDHAVVFRCHPRFELHLRLHLSLRSAKFHKSTLFFTTDDDISCVFLTTPNYPPVVLSSIGIHSAILPPSPDAVHSTDTLNNSDSSRSDPSHSTNSSCYLGSRPMGALSILGVDDERLEVLGIGKTVHVLRLDKPSLRFKLLVTAGQPEDALELGKTMDASCHDQLAEFMSLSGYAEKAIDLPHITDCCKLRLATKYFLFVGAYEMLSRTLEALEQQQLEEVRSAKNRTVEAFQSVLSRKDSKSFVKMEVSELLSACQSLGQLAEERENPTYAEKFLLLACRLDELAYPHLVAHYVRHKRFSELEQLHDRLVSEKKYHSAQFACLYLEKPTSSDHTECIRRGFTFSSSATTPSLITRSLLERAHSSQLKQSSVSTPRRRPLSIMHHLPHFNKPT